MIHAGGTVHAPGCPLTRAIAQFHVIGVDVIATAGWDGSGQVRECWAAAAGTDDSPWRDRRADDSDPGPGSDQAAHDNLENLPESFPARRTAPGPLQSPPAALIAPRTFF